MRVTWAAKSEARLDTPFWLSLQVKVSAKKIAVSMHTSINVTGTASKAKSYQVFISQGKHHLIVLASHRVFRLFSDGK
jgi:alpha-D-ribose 1-methylphosphonate 5-triphosphate synthase subunit PhnH